jgi:hypothetical protein
LSQAATLRTDGRLLPAVRPRFSIRIGAAATVGLVATLLALVVTYPLALHPASMIYGSPGDSTGTIAIFWWWSYALEHGKGILDNTAWGAPFGAGWAGQPFAVLPLLVFTPLSVLFGPTVAYNLGVVSSFPLTAVTAYLAGRRLRMTTLAAAFSGLAFAFLPYHQMKATGHLLQAHMEFFPGLLYFLLRWRDGGSRWNLAGAGAMVGLALWTDYQFAFIIFFLTAAFFFASLLASLSAGSLGRHLGAAGLTAASVLLFVPAAVLLAHRPGSGSIAGELGAFQRDLNQIDIYSNRPWEYLFPWSQNPLLPAQARAFVAAHLHGSNSVEQAQTLGYTVILLALAALVWFRPRFPVLLALVIAGSGVFLALPADFHAFGYRFHGPAFLLNRVVPFIRVYARFGVLVMLGATLLAGLGFTVLEGAIRSLKRPLILAIPFLLLALEFNGMPPAHTTAIFPAPDEYTWLKSQPAGIVIEYPAVIRTQAEEVTSRGYTLYQQVHLHPIFNGSDAGSAADRLAPSLDPYYQPGVSARLYSLGIRYLIVHRQSYEAAGYGLPRAVDGLQLAGTFDHGDADVFLVKAP